MYTIRVHLRSIGDDMCSPSRYRSQRVPLHFNGYEYLIKMLLLEQEKKKIG